MLQGSQRPRVYSVPPYVSTTGTEAIELARMAGLELDDWQQFILDRSLGERADGKWSAFEVGIAVGRQNGKNAVLEARELAGLFLLNERLIVHSAHEFGTSLESFRRLLERIESCPDLERRVQKVSRSHGEEGIELKSGQRIRFRTRTKGGGRGFTADLLVLDECMELPEAMIGALLPTLSARANPQVWYTGSPVDQVKHDHGIVFARLRERGHAGDDPSLAWFEWSIDAPNPDAVEPETLNDPNAWAQANPGLGIRISVEHVARELPALGAREFAIERLGVGDWPRTDGGGEQPIPLDAWRKLEDGKSVLKDPIILAVDVSPSRQRAALWAAGANAEGNLHLERVQHGRGVAWVADRLTELCRKHEVTGVIRDPGSPAGSLDLSDLPVKLIEITAREYAHACGRLHDDVVEGKLRHLGDTEILAALEAARTRKLSDAWAWDRRTSKTDITPLVAATLAAWGWHTHGGSAIPEVWHLADVIAQLQAEAV